MKQLQEVGQNNLHTSASGNVSEGQCRLTIKGSLLAFQGCGPKVGLRWGFK